MVKGCSIRRAENHCSMHGSGDERNRGRDDQTEGIFSRLLKDPMDTLVLLHKMPLKLL